MIKVKLEQGPALELQARVEAGEALKALGVSSDRRVVAARMDGEPVDLSRLLERDCTIAPIQMGSPEGLTIMRHSAAHIMAEAVRHLFPVARVAIGPAIENGFYYDFEVPEPFTPEDLEKIEGRMRELVAQDQPFVRGQEPREQAIETFKAQGEIYKVELLQEIPQEKVSLYRQGDFIDLCRGPHLPSTGYLKAFKLTTSSGAYWRGDERRPMLQRIYGTAFPSPQELKQHLEFLEEAKRRDHRRLGRELELFSIEEEAGAGLVIYHPKGAILRSIIED
ncbi:MAG: threonine--tRNA ligase, partial [Desulfobaccales bacterium]